MTSTLVKLSHIYTYTQESDGALYCRTRTGGKYRYQTRKYKKMRKLSRRMQIYWEASHLKSPVSEKGLDQLLLWEKNSFGLQELVSRPHIPVLLCSTVKNTDTLLKVHPVVFRGLSGALLRFLGSQFHFWRSQSVFSGGSCSSENHGLC